MDIRYPEEQKQKRQTWKWILWGCGGCLVAAIILTIVGIFFGYRFVRDRIVLDPCRVEQMAGEIVRYDIPGGSRGLMGMNIGFKMAILQDMHDPADLLLIVASIPGSWSGDFEKELELKMDRFMTDQQDFRIDEVKKLSETFCGEEVTVYLKKGTVNRNGTLTPLTSYHAMLKRNGYAVFAMVMGIGDEHDHRARGVFDSLECIEH